MNFGTTNAPTFYSVMMINFKYEWVKLFIIWVKSLSYINVEPVSVKDSFDIIVGKQKITSGTKKIIDNILLYCSNKYLVLLYLECICIIFRKYIARFCLYKCEFIKDQI